MTGARTPLVTRVRSSTSSAANGYGARVDIDDNTTEQTLFGWTFAGGNGFSFTIAAEDPASSGRRGDGSATMTTKARKLRTASRTSASTRVGAPRRSWVWFATSMTLRTATRRRIGFAVGGGLSLGIPGGWTFDCAGRLLRRRHRLPDQRSGQHRRLRRHRTATTRTRPGCSAAVSPARCSTRTSLCGSNGVLHARRGRHRCRTSTSSGRPRLVRLTRSAPGLTRRTGVRLQQPRRRRSALRR